MRTDWYKGIDPNLERLTELLSMSKPSHGYTIAENAPEIVTAPGVYFPARKGEVIPLESRQEGGNVNHAMNPTSNDMVNNTEDGKMKILASALKSIDKIVSSVSPKPMQLESRQEGGGVTSLLDRIERDPRVFTETSSMGAPNPEGDIQAGKGLDALSSAMRESNLAILTPPPISLEQKEASMASVASSIPGLPSPPTSRSYGIQPEATKLGGSDLLWQEQNEKRKKRIPLFSAQEGAVTIPPIVEDESELEKKRKLIEAMKSSTPNEAVKEILPSGEIRYTLPEGTLTASAPNPTDIFYNQQVSDRWKKEEDASIQNLSDAMKYDEQVVKARKEQEEYDRYLADKELREAAGISSRRGMPEYEYTAARMRMTPGEKYVADISKGKLAEQYIAQKGALDVAKAKPTTPPVPHLVQNERGEYVWATPGGILPAGIMGKTTPRTVSTEELVRSDLRKRLGREASEGEILNELDRRKLNVQTGGIPPLSPDTQTIPKIKGVKNDAALEGLTEDQKGIIKGLTNYNYPWPGSFAMRDPKWVALMGRAEKYDPEFNAAEYQVRYNLRKSFTSGKDKDNLLALNTAIGHIDSLVKAKDELANSNWPTANAATNLLAKYFPVSEGLVKRLGVITGVKTKFNAVAGEMANIFKRSGATDQEIKSWKSTITDPSTATPAMWDAFINGSLELMGSRISALKDRYESGLGKAKDFGFLSSASRGILQGLGVDVDAIDPTPIGQKTVVKQFVSPSTGKTKYIYSDGTEEIK